MDDLISRRVVIDMLSKQLDYLDMLDKYDNPTAVSQWYGINWARNRIADLPSVQPEIIRCKDCDWWLKQPDGLQGSCMLFGMHSTGAWYCGDARKREEKDDE